MALHRSAYEGGRISPSVQAMFDQGISLAHEAPVRLGALNIEPARRRVVHDDGREEIVEPRVMQVFVALIRAGGQILTRDELMMSCWRGVVVGEDAINRVMGRLRRLAAGLASGCFELQTITKVGYRLVSDHLPREVLSAEVGPAPPAGRLSICVLPFANMSDDPQQEYFSDGICEDVITDLSKVSSLFVVARTTAFAYKGKPIDVPRLAADLNVGHVLEGSVRRVGRRVRITAQLIDGMTGGHVWAERYDRDLKDIFALQDEISEAIVTALKLTLLPEEKQAIVQRGTADLDAYNLYLMARRFYVTGCDGDLRALEAIERLCGRVTELDPGYARAWALLGVAQTLLHFNHSWPGETGLTAIERALQLDSGLAEAHAAKARHLAEQDRFDDAFAQVGIALRLDPDSWAANAEAGRLNYVQHRFSEAIVFWEKATALPESPKTDPGRLMSCYTALGDNEGVKRAARLALARADQALAQDHVDGASIGCGASALAVLGEAEQSRDLIRRALLIDPDNLRMRYNFACGAALYLQDPELALDLLSAVFAGMSSSWLKHMMVDPDLVDLRKDARFASLLADARQRLSA